MANKWYIAQVTNKIKRGGARGLQAVADIIGDEAQRITPLDTGELETSLRIAVDTKALIAGIGFTKFVDGVDVALIQHEDLSLNHAPGKQAKYLQQPFFQLGPMLLQSVLGQEIRKEF
jgi:hypothetical protein